MFSTSQRTLAWLVLAVVTGVSLLTAAGLAAIHQSADRHRREEVLIVRIEGLAHRLVSLNWEVELDHEITPRRMDEVGKVQEQLAADLKELEDLHGTEIAALIRSAFAQYSDALSNQLHLISTGQDDVAHDIGDTAVEDAYRHLLNTTADARTQYQSMARRAASRADVTIVAIIIVAATLIARVVVRYERVRRSALEAEQQVLRQSEERLRSLVSNATDVLQILGSDGAVRWSSPAVHALWGREPDATIGHSVADTAHPADRREMDRALRATLTRRSALERADVRIVHADGSLRDCEVILSNLLHEPGVQGIVATFRDVTERKVMERELRRLAYQDPLTGLPNRTEFMNRLSHLVTRPMARASTAVMFLDLDNFKLVNDGLGHHSGDRLLADVARRVTQCLPANAVVARLGGDEFALLLEDIVDATEAATVAEGILACLRAPFSVGDRETFVGASIGIAMAGEDDADPETLVGRADMAMYRAKSKGKSRYEVFDASMNEAVAERLELETDLRRALDRPISGRKVDRSFVASLGSEREDAAIVEAPSRSERPWGSPLPARERRRLTKSGDCGS